MQVSHGVESDSVAVIGGGKKRNFSMAASAHAFKIMSEALYSNKPLAVVREVICNAHDAHVRAGRVDTPIEITITESEFIVKDAGDGIADDRIDSIFCSMFNSDKGDLADETGGFGAGSKAPFAVTDNFIVTSRYDGTRTVYSMHKAGEETGLPVCQNMTSGPCGAETGLTVSIPVDNKNGKYTALARQIVFNGGINAIVNGEKAPTRDYSRARELGYCFALRSDHAFAPGRYAHYYVLLGTVLYPLDVHKLESSLLRKYEAFQFRSGVDLILCAKPGTVEPTPSRESISYTEDTIDALNALMHNMIERLKGRSDTADDQLTPFITAHLRSVFAKMNKKPNRFDFSCGVSLLADLRNEYRKLLADISSASENGALLLSKSELANFYVINYLSKDEYRINGPLKVLRYSYRDYARNLRRAGKQEGSRFCLNFRSDLRELDIRTRLKQIIRILQPNFGGASKEAYFALNKGSSGALVLSPLETIFNSKRYSYGQRREPYDVHHIYVAKSATDMRELIKKYAITSDFSTLIRHSVVVVNPEADDAFVTAMADRAKKFAKTGEISVSLVPSAVRAPRKTASSKKVKIEKLRALPADFNRIVTPLTSNPDLRIWLAEPELEKPDCYVSPFIYRPKKKKPTDPQKYAMNLHHTRDQHRAVISKALSCGGLKIGVVTDRAEQDFVEKNGIPYMFELVTKHLRGFADQETAALYYNILKRRYDQDKYGGGGRSFAIPYDRAFALSVLGLNSHPSAELDRIWNFTRMLIALCDHPFGATNLNGFNHDIIHDVRTELELVQFTKNPEFKKFKFAEHSLPSSCATRLMNLVAQFGAGHGFSSPEDEQELKDILKFMAERSKA